MLRTFIITAAFAASTLAAPAAFAGDIHEVRVETATVKLGDLDLSQSKDAARAIERLARTAARLCSPEGGSLTVTKPDRVRRCEQAAVAKAVAQASSPMLTLALSEWQDRANVQVAGR